MRYIKTPNPFAINPKNLNGVPMMAGSEPLTITFRNFLLERLYEAPLVEGLKGLAAAELVRAFKEWIDEMYPETLKAPSGYSPIPDDRHSRLLKSIENADFDPRFRHELVPFMHAIRDALTEEQHFELKKKK